MHINGLCLHNNLMAMNYVLNFIVAHKLFINILATPDYIE